MQLVDLKENYNARIVSLSAVPKSLRKKLFAMGLLPNTEFHVIRVAPFGDPLQIRVRGFDLAISKELAKNIEVAIDVK